MNILLFQRTDSQENQYIVNQGIFILTEYYQRFFQLSLLNLICRKIFVHIRRRNL